LAAEGEEKMREQRCSFLCAETTFRSIAQIVSMFDDDPEPGNLHPPETGDPSVSRSLLIDRSKK
jgi:hypothetical protein